MSLLSTGPWGDSDPTIPEMDTHILELHSKVEKIDWENEDSVVGYIVELFALASGRKEFDNQRIEKYVRAEFIEPIIILVCSTTLLYKVVKSIGID